MKLPVKVAPACSRIVSPGWAVLSAACRSPPALTAMIPPLGAGEGEGVGGAGVAQPLAVGGPADVVAAEAVLLDVDVGLACVAAAVAGGRVVIGDALAAVVEPFDAQGAGERDGRTGIRCRGGCRAHRLGHD